MQSQGNSDNQKGNFQKIGEGMGGLAGQAADMGMNWLSSMFGGGLNSMGGWWSQQADQQQPPRAFGADDDSQCRRHFEASLHGGTGDQGGLHVGAELNTESRPTSNETGRGTGNSYESARPLYQFGHLAGQNPDYGNRSFNEVEPDLRRAWGEEQTQKYGAWPDVRSHVEFGYSRDRQQGD